MDKTKTCTFTGLTAAQAKTLASWYEGQGEQDAEIWFDEWCEDGTPMATGALLIDGDGNVTQNCH